MARFVLNKQGRVASSTGESNESRTQRNKRQPTRSGFPTDWIPVSSTCLSAIRVWVTGNYAVSLVVRFRESGSEYRYRGVSHSVVSDLLSASSIGRYYNVAIKGQYPSYGPL